MVISHDRHEYSYNCATDPSSRSFAALEKKMTCVVSRPKITRLMNEFAADLFLAFGNTWSARKAGLVEYCCIAKRAAAPCPREPFDMLSDWACARFSAKMAGARISNATRDGPYFGGKELSILDDILQKDICYWTITTLIIVAVAISCALKGRLYFLKSRIWIAAMALVRFCILSVFYMPCGLNSYPKREPWEIIVDHFSNIGFPKEKAILRLVEARFENCFLLIHAGTVRDSEKPFLAESKILTLSEKKAMGIFNSAGNLTVIAKAPKWRSPCKRILSKIIATLAMILLFSFPMIYIMGKLDFSIQKMEIAIDNLLEKF